jgi:hypothetical protein
VNFGPIPARSLTVNSSTTLTATSPPGDGTVDVTVSNSAATSAISAADQFSYTGDGQSDIERPTILTEQRSWGGAEQPGRAVDQCNFNNDGKSDMLRRDAATYVVLCVYSTAGLQRVKLGAVEQYGEVLSGAFIAWSASPFGCGRCCNPHGTSADSAE